MGPSEARHSYYWNLVRVVVGEAMVRDNLEVAEEELGSLLDRVGTLSRKGVGTAWKVVQIALELGFVA